MFANGNIFELILIEKKHFFYINYLASPAPNQCLSMLSDGYNIRNREGAGVKDEEGKWNKLHLK